VGCRLPTIEAIHRPEGEIGRPAPLSWPKDTLYGSRRAALSAMRGMGREEELNGVKQRQSTDAAAPNKANFAVSGLRMRVRRNNNANLARSGPVRASGENASRRHYEHAKQSQSVDGASRQGEARCAKQTQFHNGQPCESVRVIALEFISACEHRT